jgi:uroporphyrin-3 C-methyltransferase
VLAILLAMLALAAVVWLAYRDNIERELADFRVQSALQDQAAGLSQLRQQWSDQRADSRAKQRQLGQDLQRLQLQLQNQEQRLTALASTDRSDWQLAEAEYLLQLANQRLLLGGDPRAALEQLQAADQILREQDDSGLLPVRGALAADIAALKALPALDIEGTYVAIAATAEQVAQLRLIQPLAMATVARESEQPETGWSERLQHGLGAALAKLGQLVQIRRRDEPYRPLLAPEYEAALRQNLQLMLEQAQMALLAGNQTLYQHSQAKARDWLTTYYTLDRDATAVLVAEIDTLAEHAITVALPDISASRRALKAYLNARHAQPPAAAETAP